MKKKVMIAMSGGVDSSVAAYLIKQQGYECIGVTMKLFDAADDTTDDNDALPDCSTRDIDDARSVADMLGIEHYVCDLSEDFKEMVINRFVDVYKAGATPNPCVYCNRHIKFGKLLEHAEKLGADYIATGHYARVEPAQYGNTNGGNSNGGNSNGGNTDSSNSNGTQTYLLKKAVDKSKDQSYVMCCLTQEQLRHIMFPLGGLTKEHIRTVATQQSLITADKRDSQDICFVPDGDYAGFIEKYTGQTGQPGNFIDRYGNILGRHRGLIRYTIGQRKGLGLALPKPMYVYSKDIETNTLVLCEDHDLYDDTLEAGEFNWILPREDYNPIRVQAKVRYSHSAQPATAEEIAPGVVHLVFDEPQRAITPGQAVALYNDDILIGGGIIRPRNE